MPMSKDEDSGWMSNHERLEEDLHAAAEVKGRLLLDVVVRQGAAELVRRA
jgi:hypothetical protein